MVFNTCIYRIWNLESRVHKSKNILIVSWFQANDVVNYIIHLFKIRKCIYHKDHRSWNSFGQLFFKLMSCSTSFSQLELRVSKAMGLLGALLPGPGGIPWSGGWLGHWKLLAWLPALPPRLGDRYCLTCCLWVCWMWYLVGFSRCVCTYIQKKTRKCAFVNYIHCNIVVSSNIGIQHKIEISNLRHW